MKPASKANDLILVLGGTGKTGRRVAKRLKDKGHPVRIGSRSSTPEFDWDNEQSWVSALTNVKSVYITYSPDLAMPGAPDAIQAFINLTKMHGVKRLVLLSGRGEAEAQKCERIVQNSGLEWTIVRSSWFNQNFSEGAFVNMVLDGAITLPASNQLEPFVDVNDIADVVVAALCEDTHKGQIYEVTGPRLMTIADICHDLSLATGRDISYVDVPHRIFISQVEESGAPKDVVWMLDYLFSTVLDGRNASLCDGVHRALGRQPKDFSDFAKEVAGTGVWEATS